MYFDEYRVLCRQRGLQGLAIHARPLDLRAGTIYIIRDLVRTARHSGKQVNAPQPHGTFEAFLLLICSNFE